MSLIVISHREGWSHHAAGSVLPSLVSLLQPLNAPFIFIIVYHTAIELLFPRVKAAFMALRFTNHILFVMPDWWRYHILLTTNIVIIVAASVTTCNSICFIGLYCYLASRASIYILYILQSALSQKDDTCHSLFFIQPHAHAASPHWSHDNSYLVV